VRSIPIGLLGLGNVGAGVVRLLADNDAAIGARLGARLEIKAAAVRDVQKPRQVALEPARLTTDPAALCADPEIRIVVEVMGGTEPARTLLLQAIAAGKHVVTANKHVLAEHGDEIFAAAAAARVNVYYEAAVCGGLPIIRALREGLASDRIQEVAGIVNGTSNFILTAMAEEGRPLDEVLRAAQAAGYAEADPSFDVDGIDACHKLTLLARLSFGARLRPEQILCDGIRQVTPTDLALARRFGYVVKPLAVADDDGHGVLARVHPALVPMRDPLASCAGTTNAIKVTSAALGQSLYQGRGAGMMPTAVAVVADLIEVCRDLPVAGPARGTVGGKTYPAGTPPPPAGTPPPPVGTPPPPARPLRDPGDLECRYYLRFAAADQPGALAQVTRVLGEHEISIWQLIQEGAPAPGQPAAVVVVTHPARERHVRSALTIINGLPVTAQPTLLLRIQE
jgi:homoserine dehydrogenase